MEQNLISAVIPAEDIASINSALETIKTKLPFLLTLSTDQKKEIHKLGNSLKPFVEKAAETVNLYPQILSGVFDKAEYNKDYQLYQELSELNGKLSSLSSAVDDTLTAVGSDILAGSLEVYTAVQENKKKVPGLDTVAQAMKVFFEKKRAVVTPPAK